MQNKTYLVLGGNGFIGSHFVDVLASDSSNDVRAFDRFSKEVQFITKPNVHILKGDIYNEKEISDALNGVDYVIYAFSATTPFTSDNDPFLDITNNIQNSVKIFKLCSEANIKKVGFISSGGAVYGTAAEKGVVSEDDAAYPVSPYGIGKLAIEHYLEYFKRKEGLEYVVYRLTNPYGPRQHTKNNQGVIPAFINNINEGKPIMVYGDGSASRDYIYIEDAARMIIESFEKPNNYPVYNIGSGQETSLNEIIDTLRQIFKDRTVEVTHNDAPKTFLTKTQVNVDRFQNEFGTPSLTNLYDGLTKTIKT